MSAQIKPEKTLETWYYLVRLALFRPGLYLGLAIFETLFFGVFP